MAIFLQTVVYLVFFISLKPGLALSGEMNIQNNIDVCYQYSCTRVGQVDLEGPEWNRITELFSRKSTSPQQERQKIGKAIALMEQLAGKKLGVPNDKAKNSGTGEPGQMDCIDESINTSRYLRLFARKGWFKWHQVHDRVKRNPFLFDVHWTAVIMDKNSKQTYAVDSWFRDNGREPVIISLQDWKAKKEKP